MKKFSIITVNYNNCEGLRKTIESVVNQTYKDFEYIIIDGGSTDGSVDVIREYAGRIDYWVSEPDKGIYNAMNKGILKATGEYLNFMNSGDCFYDNEVLNDFSKYGEDVVLGKYKKESCEFGLGHVYDDVTMIDLCKGSFNHQSAFMRRILFENNLYDEHYKIVSDWKFFIDVLIFKNCSFRNVNRIVVSYDMTGISSLSKEKSLQERDVVLQQMLPIRIYSDYKRLAPADSPLLELTPLLNKTYGFQKAIYLLVKFLIKTRLFLRKLIGKND